ncbi:hypothetical protein AVEN_41144-1, partial [Araneus ventricosus]
NFDCDASISPPGREALPSSNLNYNVMKISSDRSHPSYVTFICILLVEQEVRPNCDGGVRRRPSPEAQWCINGTLNSCWSQWKTYEEAELLLLKLERAVPICGTVRNSAECNKMGFRMDDVRKCFGRLCFIFFLYLSCTDDGISIGTLSDSEKMQ